MAGLTPLTELAAGLDTDKESRHGYLSEVYEHVLLPYRALSTKVLQVGLGRPGDVGLWRAAFPKARVWAVADADSGVDDEMPYFSVIIVEGLLTTLAKVDAIRQYARRATPQGVMVVEGVDSPGALTVLCDAARDVGFYDMAAWDTSKGRVALVLR